MQRDLAKYSNEFPVVGALIGIGIDVALGERLDRAIVGSLGSSIGAGIGGILGQIAIPIPFFGAAAGGILVVLLVNILVKNFMKFFELQWEWVDLMSLNKR